jgi:tricorn protease
MLPTEVSVIMKRFPSLLCAMAVLSAVAGLVPVAGALEECRLLRQPDIEGDRIVFVYAGDLWAVARAGGVATRLTTHEGVERFPQLSPDGSTVAFTAEYDGNVDVYSVPIAGGEPTRLTWHPSDDQVAGWYPDGKAILFRSIRASAPTRYDRFFKIPASGGFEELLPLPTAGYCSFSADARRIAFVSPSYDRRTWKRYRGGNAPDIWIYDFVANTSQKMTDWPGPDEWPMWHENTVYYCSDRGGRIANLWAYDVEKKTHRQVTNFTEYDVKWPSIGGDAIVFENGGYLYVMDLPAEKPARIKVLVPDDKPGARAEVRNVSAWITDWDLSPSAKRAVIAARGDLFTVPAENGDPRNLTETPGARERDPAWSPDGKWIVYLSDQSGEYEIHVVGSDGKAPARQVTHGGGTFRFAPRWSPDSKKIVFSDKTMTLWWCDVATGKLTRVDKSEWGEIHDYNWSPDSKWIVYSKTFENTFNRLMLFGLDAGRPVEVTDGMTDDVWPAFDPEGKHLFFVSRRTVAPEFGAFDFDFQFRATDKIYALSLRDTVPSPVAPKSDEETGESAGDGGKGDGAKGAAKSAKAEGKAGDAAKKEAPQPVTIQLEGLAGRCAALPVPAGRYSGLTALKGKLLYLSDDDAGPGDDDAQGHASVHVFDFEKRKDQTIIEKVGLAYAASKDGGKILYHSGETFGIVEAVEGKKSGDGKIKTESLMALVDPRQEWREMFDEAWRLERDFYYDPAMGGLDWKAVGDRHRQLVPFVAHRADLSYLLGELIGELATSHAYVTGAGDVPQTAKVDVGLLGADYALDTASGLYRFKTIYRQRDWNSKVAAPLGEPGIGVREGDLLLEVNGRPVRAPQNLYAGFVNTTGKQTTIKVGARPGDAHARTYTVVPIASEASLRYTAWVAANREKVTTATHGQVAYIHVPNTSTSGIQEFTKQYYPQVDKRGIIVDERFNGGGFIPDFFVERLWRKTWTAWSNRDGGGFRTPSTAIDGPKCILVNEYAGSGGDCFPFYFRMQGLGPVIGKRTWGGLVGISHSLPLVDGGSVTMPDFGMYDPRTGQWLVENHGVDPDIEVENAPDLMVQGRDPQLERGIQYCMDQLKTEPPFVARRPAYKVQEGLKASGPSSSR